MRGSNRTIRLGGRSTSWRLLGTLVAITGLILTAPASQGLTIKAPYVHVVQTKLDWLQAKTGCAKVRSSTPAFRPVSGNISWTGSASVGRCGGVLSKAFTDNLAESEGASELSIAVRVPAGSATHTTFNVTWNLTVSGGIGTLTTGPCYDPLPSNTSGSYECVAVEYASLIGGAWLVDLTNGTVTLASNAPVASGVAVETVNYTLCSPNCTSYPFSFKTGSAFSGLQTDTFTINATTNHADRYDLVTYVGGWAAAELDGFSGRASAFVNMGTSGNGAQLVSIMET
jgi:hypothetical protein